MSDTDDFFKEKRPWSLIKDKVLNDYLQAYLAKVSYHRRNPILIVDGFAGPGVFEDGSEGSPIIICQAAERFARGNWHAKFVNIKQEEHDALTEEIKKRGWSHCVETICGNATKVLSDLPATLGDQTVFLYLDPFGVSDIEFNLLEPFLKRNPNYITEIVLVMHIPIVLRLATAVRMQQGYGNEGMGPSYHNRLTKVFGGDYWKNYLWDDELNPTEQSWRLIEAYSQKLRQYLPYAGYCPVRETDDTRIKYFVVFVSRHQDALVLMNDVMANAYHGHMMRDRIFGWRDMRDGDSLTILTEAMMKAVTEKQGQKRKDLWAQVVLKLMPEHFMKFTHADYRKKIEDFIKAGQLRCDGTHKANRHNDDCRIFLPINTLNTLF